MSFQHFCRLDGALHIPDARTLWSFNQRLAKGGLGGQTIFDAVSQQLQAHGYIPRGGQIVDASIVQAPITQTKSEEREALNQGKAPECWDAKRLAHTDRDARWTKKHGKSFYGYKLHANADARYKLIRRVKVTAANIDDGQTRKDVLDTSNTRGAQSRDKTSANAWMRATRPSTASAPGASMCSPGWSNLAANACGRSRWPGTNWRS